MLRIIDLYTEDSEAAMQLVLCYSLHNSKMPPPKPFFFFFFFVVLLLARVDSAQPQFSCNSADPSTKSYTFCKTSLPISLRARDLVSRLTLDEKISQLVSGSPAIPRLGIPRYEWWSEALHGVANCGKGIALNGTIKAATSFPQVILSAASFDVHEWYLIGQAIGTEARAIYNAGQAAGMTFWAPNINIFRDPRWGRGQETPGEDPLVAGKYSVSFVRGVQGDNFDDDSKMSSHLKASACCKHFTAYDLDNWKNMNRFHFDAHVTMQDLADTYQPPFEKCVKQGRASGIMCAYNKVNGVPNCANPDLLTKLARGEWGFNGYITSDCDAVSLIYDDQGFAKSPEDAIGEVLKAGMDVDCGTYMVDHNNTKSALQKKKLQEKDIDRALHNLFSMRMRLGLFNGDPSKQPYGDIGADQVCSPAHKALAVEVARNGIVLLKNNDKLLPLPKTTKSILVVGPNGDNAQTLKGNYFGIPCESVTPLQGLQKYVKDVTFYQGCNNVACTNAKLYQTADMAGQFNEAVLVMGLDQTQETEEHDRDDLVLPGLQQRLVTMVARAANKPVTLVIMSGGPVDISFAKDDPAIGAIIWAGYPGQSGGTALAEIIFGDHNPGGRLPLTWYPQDFVQIPMTDMRMRPDASGYPGRTYRFYKGKTVYDFGYGLSYTRYSYQFKHVTTLLVHLADTSSQVLTTSDSIKFKMVSDLSEEFCKAKKFTVNVAVKNHGDMAGKHPVLLFVKHRHEGDGRPRKQLIGFKRVILSGAEEAEVQFELSPCEHLSTANENGAMVIEEGERFLLVGDDHKRPITVAF